MGKLLLIEDDAALASVLSLAFEDAGHEVIVAKDGLEGFARITRDRPDLVISDVNMPRLDGFSLCRRLREAGNLVPLILLTSRDSEIDEALGLELGADDYVAKPFSTRVLLLRVHALLRRKQAPGSAATSRGVVAAGPLRLDPERIEARYHDTPIAVTLTEFRLLEALVARPGVVFSRERLLELARGDESVVDARLVDTYVRRLRRKFEAVEPAFDGIETVVGAGYRYKDRGA
ncbi:response regulator transcription factor [Polyangium jinanense]|uniref:Response regulator transcription factor n=1 Tax=Polyangium jinanense TaxID=2829994 RepID=A0A9X3XIW1_9BACT|nr:response regulator transcription factor [Polyangium jinanense]MDC3959733.1 response regulator transcription factor [Polyangium jinanense]MDC3989523.1 response regulator transcription factor [Polyangium jinanense]